jgi:hypothetical protein
MRNNASAYGFSVTVTVTMAHLNLILGTSTALETLAFADESILCALLVSVRGWKFLVFDEAVELGFVRSRVYSTLGKSHSTSDTLYYSLSSLGSHFAVRLAGEL